MKYSLILVLLLLILSLGIVSAQPPFQETGQDSPQGEGYLIIETGFPRHHRLGDDYFIHTHVYNGTDGKLITEGVDCYYHFYNHQIKGGEHIDTGILGQYGDGYYNYTNGSLLNQTGEYSVLLWCESGTEGGFVKYGFEITPTGTEGISTALVLILFLGSILFGFFSWFFYKDAFLHLIFLFSSMVILLYGINELHTPVLFFTAVVVVVLTFAYYILNYIRETLQSFNESRGFEW